MPPSDGLHIRDLVLDFRLPTGTLRALDGIDLDVAPGEILGLVGESGSGKTTLGKTILGVHQPGAGSILHRGQDLVHLSPSARRPVRRAMQMVFQDPLSSFNPRFTIGSSLALPLRLHAICPKPAIPAEIDALLTKVGLRPEHARRYPHELSGGQLQRAAIARAIGVRPDIVIADEAVSKLDISVRAQLLNLLKRMNRETGVGIVFITHDLGVARFLCDRIAVMFFGRIVEIGPTEALFAAPRHPYTRALVGARTGLAASDTQAGPTPEPSRACNYAPRCPRRLPACTAARPPLAGPTAAHQYACINPAPSA